MKRLLILLSLMFFITGCTKAKTMVCTTTGDFNGFQSKTILMAKIKNQEIKNMRLSIDLKVSDYNEKQQMLSYFASQGKSEVSSTNEGIRMTAGMGSSYFDAFSLSKDVSYNELKQVLELQGFTCENK